MLGPARRLARAGPLPAACLLLDPLPHCRRPAAIQGLNLCSRRHYSYFYELKARFGSEKDRLDAALHKMHGATLNPAASPGQIFDHALLAMRVLASKHAQERNERGSSVRDMLIEATSVPALPALETLAAVTGAVPWDAFLKCIAAEDALSCFALLLRIFLGLPRRHERQYSRLISICSDFFLIGTARELFRMAHKDLKHRVHPMVYESMIGCYARVCDFQSALAVFLELEGSEHRATIDAHVQLLEAFVKATDLELASHASSARENAFFKSRRLFADHILDEHIRTIDIDPALDIYRQLLYCGLRPTSRVFTLLLLLAARVRSIPLAEQVLKEMAEFGIEPDEHVCGLVTHLYASLGHIQQAEQFMSDFHERRKTSPSLYSLNALLAVHTKLGNASQAMRILDSIKAASKPNFMTYSMLFGMFLDLDRLPDALQILEQMRASGHGPKRHNYNHMLAYYSRKNNYASFFALLEHMRGEGVDGGEYARAMTICMYGRQGRYDMLRAYWEVLKTSGVKISITEYGNLLRYLLAGDEEGAIRDVAEHLKKSAIFTADCYYTSRTLLYAFTRAGDHASAIMCLEQLAKEHPVPEIHLFNLLLHLLILDGKLSEAQQVARLLARCDPCKDQTCYALLIHLAGEVQDMAQADLLWTEYAESGLPAMAEPVRSFMGACIQNGRAARAIDVFSKVREGEGGLAVGESLYALYMEALIASGGLGGCWGVLDEMEARRVATTTRTFNLLLNAFSGSKDPESFERVLGEMERRNVRPNKYSYALIVQHKIARNQLGEVESLVGELEKYDVKIADCARGCFISALLRQSAGLGDSFCLWAQQISAQMSRPTGAVLCSWILYYGRVGAPHQALQTYETMRAHNLQPDAWIVDFVSLQREQVKTQ